MCVNFSEFITKKYIDWRGDETGNKKSISRYARDVIGVTPQLFSEWMNRGKKPDRKNILKLAEKLGPRVYDVLGLPRPPVDISLNALPPAMREALLAATAELAEIFTSNKIDPASLEGEALTISVMEKHGFKWSVTQNPEQPG